MRIKGIIFDIDGVLADSKKAVVINTITLLKEFHFPFKRADVEKMSSAHSAESVLLALAPSLKNNGEILKKMMVRLSEITAKNIHLIKPTSIARKIPSLSKKYRLAVATNRRASAKMVLDKLGVTDYFKAIATGIDAPPKPNPKMLKIALRKMKLKAHEAVFIGDNKEDAEAGLAAGITTILIDTSNPKDVEEFEELFLSRH